MSIVTILNNINNIQVVMADGRHAPLSLDALRVGIQTEQCACYGHAHQVLQRVGDPTAKGCLSVFDLKEDLGGSGLIVEHVHREIEIRHRGGDMKYGIGGVPTVTHHKEGVLRVV